MFTENDTVITVTVHSARDLRAADANGFSDPYCKVVIGEAIAKTEVIPKTLNPTWETTMRFKVDPNKRVKLQAEVFDHDKIGNDDSLGSAQLEISVPNRLKIEVPLTDKKAQGSLLLSLLWTGPTGARLFGTTPKHNQPAPPFFLQALDIIAAVDCEPSLLRSTTATQKLKDLVLAIDVGELVDLRQEEPGTAFAVIKEYLRFLSPLIPSAIVRESFAQKSFSRYGPYVKILHEVPSWRSALLVPLFVSFSTYLSRQSAPNSTETIMGVLAPLLVASDLTDLEDFSVAEFLHSWPKIFEGMMKTQQLWAN